jgi:hypothetical protein
MDGVNCSVFCLFVGSDFYVIHARIYSLAYSPGFITDLSKFKLKWCGVLQCGNIDVKFGENS